MLSFVASSLFSLESELGAKSLLLLFAIARSFLDHTCSLCNFRPISRGDCVVFADLRLLLASETGCYLVELGDDVAFLLQLLLLVVLDGLTLINLIKVKCVCSAASTHFATLSEHAFISFHLLALFGLKLSFDVVGVLPSRLVSIAWIEVVTGSLQQLLLPPTVLPPPRRQRHRRRPCSPRPQQQRPRPPPQAALSPATLPRVSPGSSRAGNW